MKKVVMIALCFALVVTFCYTSQTPTEAKATKKAMKFLKGTWVSVGQSGSVKVIFTKKYMKSYDLWDSKHINVKSPKKKGKYFGKSKIISTKKKGKVWTIKVRNSNGTTIYKGYGDGLTCYFKDHGKWMMSATSSYNRYSKKVYK